MSEYNESNARAVVYPAAGVVQLLPIVLNEQNESFVKMFDSYVRPETVSGYQRTEILPQYRDKKGVSSMTEAEKAYQDEREYLQRLIDADKRREHRDELARQQCRAQHAADLEAERLERERIANLPTPEETEFPIAGLHFVNGQRVVKPTPQISQAVIKTEQLRAANLAALRNKK